MSLILVFLVSLLVASFCGHVIHWTIHQKWTGPAYKGHMEHHLQKYPPKSLLSKIYRKAKWYHAGTFLFLPPLVLILVGGSMFLSWCGGGWAETVVFVVTMVGFGIVNDYVHDATHLEGHSFERYEWFRRLRDVHMVHHLNMKRNFGIVFMGWDKLFGTFKGPEH